MKGQAFYLRLPRLTALVIWPVHAFHSAAWQAIICKTETTDLSQDDGGTHRYAELEFAPVQQKADLLQSSMEGLGSSRLAMQRR